ncbi:RNA polymerase II elongation factor Ell-like isoform X2 [Varroa destructor]|uniref:OCEL domain-containing protein n=1 Tax=Varroa destructor TaxID=109461 RepID=A0A7M7MAV6_VARDE|nr:RNA polymerase II elongation factor Ell-like isoform X2 [Varroa destructor]
MAALVEGCRYGLSSEGTNSSDRTLIFVKLTDSALKAVEDFVKFKNATARTASIKFDGNTGTIHIPNLRQDSTRSFGFNVSSLDKDASLQQGSFDCIRQTPGGAGPGRGELDKLGALVHKMQIAANEDSYEKTRERMATAEQVAKKNCAKVIKITEKNVGRKVKLKRPPGSVMPPAPPTSPPFRTAPGRNSLAPSARQTDRLDSSSLSGGSASRLERPEQRLERLVEGSMPTLPVTSGQTSLERQTPALVSSSNSNVSMSSKNHSPAQANKANRFSNDIMKRSYRERLIHMLAVRPLKKPEILARLIKEGVKESEKKGMTALLSQITTLKDSTFHLIRAAWQEVHEDDWPFYTAEERLSVKKNRASMEREDSLPRHSSTLRVSPLLSGPMTPSNPSSVVSSDSGVHSNHSPSSHSEEATTPNHPHGGAAPGYTNATSQRDREIDRERREHRERERDFERRERDREQRERDSLKRVSPSTASFSDSGAGVDSKRMRLNNAYGGSGSQSKKSPPISPPLAPPSSRSAPWVTMGSTGSSYCQSSPECVSPSSQDYKSTGSSPSGDVPEYVARYVEITNQEQRFRYKCDFAAEYPRYRQLHQLLDQVSHKFVELESTLRKCNYGSEDFRRVANEIMAEYRKSKNDQEYQNAKKNFQYLHDKLGHIKQLVADFDRVHS